MEVLLPCPPTGTPTARAAAWADCSDVILLTPSTMVALTLPRSTLLRSALVVIPTNCAACAIE